MRIETNSPPMGRRAGLTLLELLVVMMIITLLAGLFLGALSSAQRLAEVTNTRSLIQKLHSAMMSRWDAYRSVRLPILIEARSATGVGNSSSEKTKFRQDIARRKMLATRELLRMEMPDRYEDLMFDPQYLVTPTKKVVRPYLWSAYQRRILDGKVIASQTDSDIDKMSSADYVKNVIGLKYQSAECLYMIMTIGTEDSSTSTEHFTARDVGDVDSDGMKEFIDAWGQPIEFLRWAPGFSSPMQPVYSYDYPGGPNTPGSIFHNTQPRDPNNGNRVVSHWKIQFENYTNTNATVNTTKTLGTRLVIIDQDDPFNPMRVGPVRENSTSSWARATRWRPGDPGPEHGYILIPLIYSCGPDRVSGLHHCFKDYTDIGDFLGEDGYTIKQSPTETDKEFPLVKFSDPYNIYMNSDNPLGVYRGASRGNGRNLDNVTNHDVGTR